MNHFFRGIALAVLLSAPFCANALADAPATTQPSDAKNWATQPGMHFILNMGLTFGGDTVATAKYTDGSSKSIKGGGLYQLGLGGLYQFESTPMALLLSANYHADSVTASNGDMSFHRYPVEILAYYTGKDRFRFGGGARIVTSPEASLTINGSTQKVTFDNTTGIVAEIGYRMAPRSWLNFRYVSEKYKVKNYTSTSGITVPVSGTTDGSHIGVNFTFEF